MVLLGGDEKAVALLCDALPERLAPLVTTIDASRAMESTGERGQRGAEPALCAGSEGELGELGRQEVAAGRLVDVAVRAAFVGGAAVRLVPAHGGPDGGIGAVLRWPA